MTQQYEFSMIDGPAPMHKAICGVQVVLSVLYWTSFQSPSFTSSHPSTTSSGQETDGGGL